MMRASVAQSDGARSTADVVDARHRDDWPILAACSVIAMLLAIVTTWRGPGLTIDSTSYLSTGVNIAESEGMRMLADQPLTIYPPGIPLIAAAGHAAGLGAEATLRIASIASFGTIVLLGARLLRRVTHRRGVVIGATALLAVSPVLLDVSRMAWSEPPFIVLTICFLLFLSRACEQGSLTWRNVSVLTALAWVAFFLRYVGVSLIVVAVLALLAAIRPFDRRTIIRIVAFGLLSASVPIAWMLRNHAADGTFLGHRSPSHDSLRDVGVRTAATFGEWLLPAPTMSTRALALAGTVGAAAVVAGLTGALRTLRSGATPPSGPGASGQALVLCCALFIVVYVAYLTVASLLTSFEPTNSRYLSPAYLPVVAVAVVGVTTLMEATTPILRRATIAPLLLAFLLLQAGVSVRDARDGAAEGIGFNSRGWTESPISATALALVEAGEQPVVYSNSPSGLWAATGMQPIHWAPRDTGFRGVPTPDELEGLGEKVACSPASSYLVIHLGGDARVASIERIRTVVDLERIAAAADGAIFRITAPKAEPCEGGTGPPPVRIYR